LPLTEEERRAIRREVEVMSREELVATMGRTASRDRVNFERATAARVELFSRLRLPKGTDIVGKKA
jgi:hypothetical protein